MYVGPPRRISNISYFILPYQVRIVMLQLMNLNVFLKRRLYLFTTTLLSLSLQQFFYHDFPKTHQTTTRRKIYKSCLVCDTCIRELMVLDVPPQVSSHNMVKCAYKFHAIMQQKFKNSQANTHNKKSRRWISAKLKNKLTWAATVAAAVTTSTAGRCRFVVYMLGGHASVCCSLH